MPEEQIQKLENRQEYIVRRERAHVINVEITKDFNEALAKYSHLRIYINDIARKIGLPEWRESLDYSLKSREEFNILYPVGDPIFIHVYKLPTGEAYYNVIEPELTKEEEEKLEKIQTKIVKYAVENIDLNNIEEVKKTMVDLFN
jgi:flagellar protein FlaI